MTNKSAPKNLVEWLGYTTEPEYSQHFWLGIIIGGILSVFIASALLITSVYFLGALTGGKGITESVSGEAALNYLLIIGGIVGAPFVVWRILVNQKLANIAEQGLITDRLNESVEQLGAEKTILGYGGIENNVPNLEVRLGAIYSLERISKDSLRDLIPIMKILTAYIRNNAPLTKVPNITTTIPRQDIEAAINVIGKRNMEDFNTAIEKDAKGSDQKYQLDLRNCNLRYAEMTSLNFENALFSKSLLGKAQLQKTNFRDAELRRVELIGANMEEATLTGTILGGANLANVGARNTNFAFCIDLTNDQLRSMFGDSTTTFPDDLDNPSWVGQQLSVEEYDANWHAANL